MHDTILYKLLGVATAYIVMSPAMSPDGSTFVVRVVTETNHFIQLFHLSVNSVLIRRQIGCNITN